MTRINVNNIFMEYQLEGDGKTIVFVHGLSDNLNYWNILTNELKNKYRVLSFDLRGHGNSSDNDEEASIQAYRQDLYCLLKALNIDNAVFVGLSLGGNIILDFAVHHPEMVNGLIVMSSFPEHTERLGKIFDDFQTAINNGFEEFFDTILPYTLTEDMLEMHKEILEEVKIRSTEIANVEGIKKGIKVGYGFNITSELKNINVPAIVIAGEKDNLTDLDIQMKISDNIKDCELIVLEDTKHNVLIDHNIQRILDVINGFMEKVDN